MSFAHLITALVLVANPARMGAEPEGDVRGLFFADDYPSDAIAARQQGTVRAQLDIDRDGGVTGCHIVESSGHASLDAQTCWILMRRARFTPAKDDNGVTVTGSYTTPTIRWMVSEQSGVGTARPEQDVRNLFRADDYPSGALRAGHGGNVRARLDISPEGRVADCSILVSSGHSSLDNATCRILVERARFAPPRDAEGEPVSEQFLTPMIVWRIAKSPVVIQGLGAIESPPEWQGIVSFLSGEAGRIEACAFERVDGGVIGAPQPCAAAHFQAAKGAVHKRPSIVRQPSRIAMVGHVVLPSRDASHAFFGALGDAGNDVRVDNPDLVLSICDGDSDCTRISRSAEAGNVPDITTFTGTRPADLVDFTDEMRP